MLIIKIIIFIILFLFIFSLLVFIALQPKSFNIDAQPPKKDSPTYPDWQAFMTAKKEIWTIQSTKNQPLEAWYLPADQPTTKTVLLANGYHSNRIAFAAFCWLFHSLGYNVLETTYTGARDSSGFFIGFGWTDRENYLHWIQEIIRKNGADSEILLFGISMGGASVMLLSGETLPVQVKAIINDCGYSSLWDEIVFKAKHDFHLPAFPLVYLMSFWSKIFASYFFKEVKILDALAKNTRPILFIHGDKDNYVPTAMVYENFSAVADDVTKQLWIAKDTGHAGSYDKHKAEYTQVIRDFLQENF
ncbi:alpha/beta hydrolase [Lactococcus nasutitermitis]|uniref:Alpha/beta hydrolase n=1 Tax=Lactococcus nasutitermitis TaxID=1652957 RepID=A0ABV9JE36_9LACT|nr:alpha/beta hydrolase [Lactococcus nasutitermitis]